MGRELVDLPEIKAELNKLGIKYTESEFHQIYVTPDETERIPYIRISAERGDLGYYIRNTGMIYEDVPFDEVIDMVKKMMGVS